MDISLVSKRNTYLVTFNRLQLTEKKKLQFSSGGQTHNRVQENQNKDIKDEVYQHPIWTPAQVLALLFLI